VRYDQTASGCAPCGFELSSAPKADPKLSGFIREARFIDRADSAPSGNFFRAIRVLTAFSIITINIRFI
jgi:hypothetical protein